MGALEALNGMLLLFGLTTAFLFAMIREVWDRWDSYGYSKPLDVRTRGVIGPGSCLWVNVRPRSTSWRHGPIVAGMALFLDRVLSDCRRTVHQQIQLR